MQPQQDFDWWHAVSGLGGGAFGTIVTWIWRAARIESNLEKAIVDSEKRFEERMGRAVDQFDETLKALRQKINDVELESINQFVAKQDFYDFRREYREDMRDLKDSISRIRDVK